MGEDACCRPRGDLFEISTYYIYMQVFYKKVPYLYQICRQTYLVLGSY